MSFVEIELFVLIVLAILGIGVKLWQLLMLR